LQPLFFHRSTMHFGPMDTNNGILCPIPEDERTPFVDLLLKFIDWQRVCIDNAEKENKKLKQELIELQQSRLVWKEKQAIDDQQKKAQAGSAKPKRIIPPLQIPQQDQITAKNVQRLLVQNIQQLLVALGGKNKRQFTRLHTCLEAEIDFGSHRYYRHPVENISLGGLYINGNFHHHSGDICTISLNPSEFDASLEVHATCSVIRGCEQGLALEFTSMKVDDFYHLQAILLYESDDPFVLGTEFVNNMNLELEKDLILCNAVLVHRDLKRKHDKT
ncbi:MAG: PilZ domain-containing protein, partial [Candidatus Electrothrix sp. MAN1_4]|nr:PilZ domain-containing protein [Candidatus Electrothrix sp. MAN1_4]